MPRPILALFVLTMLSACGDTLLERGVSGAAIGAGAAAVTDNDVATGAVIGAGAGAATELLD